jgi:hypothetical protein
MTKKLFALMLAALFAMNASAFADTKKPRAKKTAAAAAAQQTKQQLAAALPASDGAVTIDAQRLLNEALPQILAANPEKLAEINAKLDEIRTRSGLDARQFEQIAVGVAFRGKTADPVILARGRFSAAALLTAAKFALKDKYREEKIGNKSVYIFSLKDIFADRKEETGVSAPANDPPKNLNFIFNKLPSEIAVASYDANTLAIGSLARVRETIEGKTKISAGVLALLKTKPNAVMSFGANTPAGLSQFLNLDDDELGQSLASIRQLSGALSIAGGNSFVSIAAKSIDAAQAKSLEDNLTGLQGLGRGLLGGAKSGDKKVYLALVENLKITRVGTEISLNTQVSNADLAALIK